MSQPFIRIEPYPFDTLGEFNRLPWYVRKPLGNLSAPNIASDMAGGGQAWCTLAIGRKFAWWGKLPEKIIGAHLYVASGRTIYAWSTWVNRNWQGLGIGTSLWENAIEIQGVSRVQVTVVSNGGWLMMNKLKARHPAMRFNISDSRDGVERNRLARLGRNFDK